MPTNRQLKNQKIFAAPQFPLSGKTCMDFKEFFCGLYMEAAQPLSQMATQPCPWRQTD
jgi:hypothetical protein